MSHGALVNASWYANINESWHTYQWVMAHIPISHGTHINESLHTYVYMCVHVCTCEYRALLQLNRALLQLKRALLQLNRALLISYLTGIARISQIMSHTWMVHVTHVNESCHTYQWVMSHTSMSHVTHINESCYAYECIISHTWMSHVTHVNESCHTH